MSVLLAACANHSADDIAAGFADVFTSEQIAQAYEEAHYFISKDVHLVFGVISIANRLDIPVGQVSFD